MSGARSLHDTPGADDAPASPAAEGAAPELPVPGVRVPLPAVPEPTPNVKAAPKRKRRPRFVL